MHGGHSVEYDQICRAAHEAGALVALRPLSVADRRKYTCACFGVTDVPEPVFQMISRMAAGNPLHTELLAEEMMRSGLVRIEEGAIVEHAETFDAIEVPERITGALLGKLCCKALLSSMAGDHWQHLQLHRRLVFRSSCQEVASTKN